MQKPQQKTHIFAGYDPKKCRANVLQSQHKEKLELRMLQESKPIVVSATRNFVHQCDTNNPANDPLTAEEETIKLKYESNM